MIDVTHAHINNFHETTAGPLVYTCDFDAQPKGVPFKAMLCDSPAVVMRTETGYIGLVSHADAHAAALVGDRKATDAERERLRQSVLS